MNADNLGDITCHDVFAHSHNRLPGCRITWYNGPRCVVRNVRGHSPNKEVRGLPCWEHATCHPRITCSERLIWTTHVRIWQHQIWNWSEVICAEVHAQSGKRRCIAAMARAAPLRNEWSGASAGWNALYAGPAASAALSSVYVQRTIKLGRNCGIVIVVSKNNGSTYVHVFFIEMYTV